MRNYSNDKARYAKRSCSTSMAASSLAAKNRASEDFMSDPNFGAGTCLTNKF
jgi:hypothetical protein